MSPYLKALLGSGGSKNRLLFAYFHYICAYMRGKGGQKMIIFAYFKYYFYAYIRGRGSKMSEKLCLHT